MLQYVLIPFWMISGLLYNLTWKITYRADPDILKISFEQFLISTIIAIPFINTHPPPIFRAKLLKRKFLSGISYAIGQICLNISMSSIPISLISAIWFIEFILVKSFKSNQIKGNFKPLDIVSVLLIINGVVYITSFHRDTDLMGVIFALFSAGSFTFSYVLIELDPNNSAGLQYLFNSLIGLLLSILAKITFASFSWMEIHATISTNKVMAIWFICHHISTNILLKSGQNLREYSQWSLVKNLWIAIVFLATVEGHINILMLIPCLTPLIGLMVDRFTEKDNLFSVHRSKFNTTGHHKVVASGATFNLRRYLPFMILIGFWIHMQQFDIRSRNPIAPMDYLGKVGLNGNDIHYAWTYMQPLTQDQSKLLQAISKTWPDKKIIVHCATNQCMEITRVMEGITSVNLKFHDITSGTPVANWTRMFPIVKIMAGKLYEDQLQKVIQMAILWKYGGLVFDARALVIDEETFISKLRSLKKNTCMLKDMNDIPLGICYLNPGDPFVTALMDKFVKSYKLELPYKWPMTARERQYHFTAGMKNWPYKYDFIHLVDHVQFLTPNPGSHIHDVTDNLLGALQIVGLPDPLRKYGILSYWWTCNIGDDIQSVATAQFVPRVDYFINRNKIINPPKENVTVVMNAYWSNKHILFKMDRYKTIKPIMVSIFVDGLWETVKKEVKKPNQYFEKFAPIGTRDLVTMRSFMRENISSKFTGCMTLWLQNPHKQPRKTKNIIYLVDVPRLMKPVLSVRDHNIVDVGHYYNESIDLIHKFKFAYSLLHKYAEAKVIVTTRLHVALPCVGLGTPVIFLTEKHFSMDVIKKDLDVYARVSGLTPLFHLVYFDKWSTDYRKVHQFYRKFNWDHPPLNPNRQKLVDLKQTAWSMLGNVEDFADTRNAFDL